MSMGLNRDIRLSAVRFEGELKNHQFSAERLLISLSCFLKSWEYDARSLQTSIPMEMIDTAPPAAENGLVMILMCEHSVVQVCSRYVFL